MTASRIRILLIVTAFLMSVTAFQPPARAALSADELMKLDDRRFLSEVLFFSTESGKKAPSADRWRVMERLRHLPVESHEEISRSLQMGYLAQAMCQYGTREDFDKLLALADQLPSDGWARRQLMNALLTKACRLEVEALRTNREPLKVSLPNVPARFDLSVRSPELFQARQLSQQIAALNPADSFHHRSNGWIGIEANWGLFFDTVSDVLHARATNGSQRLAQFQWGSWCGTGADMFRGPHARALFVAYLQERNHGAALAKLLQFSGGSFLSMPSLTDDGAWGREFISRCGIDWETLYAGAVAAGGAHGDSSKLHDLACHGSEKGARLLLLMADESISASSGYLRALGALIEAGAPSGRTNGDGTMTLIIRSFGQSDFRRTATNEIPADVQSRLLDVLHGKLRFGVSADTAGTVCEVLGELRRRESIPALRNAMLLPFTKVRESAASTLRELGEVATVVSLPPVSFRLLTNGVPLRNIPVNYELAIAGGGATSSSLSTDGDGMVRLARDLFVDPSRPVTNVVFFARRLNSISQPWFEAQRRPPADLAAVSELNATLKPLTLELATALDPEFFAAESVQIQLRAMRHHNYGMFHEQVSEGYITNLWTSRITFESLQPGRYQIVLRVRGAAQWESGDITVGEGPNALRATLQRGADVCYSLVGFGAAAPSQQAFEIIRGGQRIEQHRYIVDWRTNLCAGLPLGEYTFRVLSTAEQRQPRGLNEIVPNTAGHRGAEVPFTISGNSPKLIDLGVIRLLPDDRAER